MSTRPPEKSGAAAKPSVWPRFKLLAAELYEFTAPKGDNKVRRRIIYAFLCLVAAKLSNLITPLLYGASVDLVNGEDGFSLTILWYLLGGYAAARLGQQIFAEAKQYLFARVAQRAVRGAAMQAFRHLHKLSLKFHLDRQTGGLTRAVERGAKGVEFLLTMATFEILPLLIEVIFVSAVL